MNELILLLAKQKSPINVVTGPTKNWIAVEGSPSHSGTTDSIPLANYSYKIASSAPRGPQLTDERNVFAIYVSYYIKVKLALSGMGGEVTLKLPFILGHIDDSLDDNQDRNDDVEKKLDNKIDTDAIAAANADDDDDDDDVDGKGGISKSIINVGSIRLEEVNRCKIDDDTGVGRIESIEKCGNKNGLSIDVIVQDMSDAKTDRKNGDAVVVVAGPQQTTNHCNDSERNINVVTAQVHSSAV